jgi:hypothetical protein
MKSVHMTHVVKINTVILLMLVYSTIFAQSSSAYTDGKLTDFSGRAMPELARELVGKSAPPVEPGKKSAPLPSGWIEKGVASIAGADFSFPGSLEYGDTRLYIDQLYKKGSRVGLIRKFDNYRQWTVTDFFAFTYKEQATYQCNATGHQIPANSVLVGFLHGDDPNRQPVPRRPTESEEIKYLKDNFGKHHPRACVGNLQTARKAAILDLTTGKLKPYESKQKVVCVSPFFQPCLP